MWWTLLRLSDRCLVRHRWFFSLLEMQWWLLHDWLLRRSWLGLWVLLHSCWLMLLSRWWTDLVKYRWLLLGRRWSMHWQQWRKRWRWCVKVQVTLCHACLFLGWRGWLWWMVDLWRWCWCTWRRTSMLERGEGWHWRVLLLWVHGRWVNSNCMDLGLWWEIERHRLRERRWILKCWGWLDLSAKLLWRVHWWWMSLNWRVLS